MNPNITDTFADGTVLITGSTGFLGKLLCDKLIRSCPLKTIALLVRSKKDFNASRRIRELFQENVSTYTHIFIELYFIKLTIFFSIHWSEY